MTILPLEKPAHKLPIIQVNDELSYQPPDPPSDRSQILFSGLPTKQQHWRHDPTDLNKHLGLTRLYFDWHQNVLEFQENTVYDDRSGVLLMLSVEDTQDLMKLRDRELQRRLTGIHFMNNGDIEYLTGDNYFFLVYYKIPGVGNPDFRKFQRDCFYVIDLAKKNPNCLGAYFAKAKKTGLSHIIASLFLNEATTIRDRAFGVMNKGSKEADDLNMTIMYRGWEELPFIMKPQLSHKTQSKIIFGAPLVKYTGTSRSVMKSVMAQRDKPLNTWIFSAPTQLNVKFDGPMMYYIHLDEFPKWKVSPKKMLEKITETVKLQQTIFGKIWITSYPPEEDGQGFEEGKEVYYDSKLATIKEGTLGRTKSGLICHFVSALDATDGTFDIYGNADHTEAYRRNEAERQMCTTAAEKQSKIRQYCRTEEECWRSGGNGSTFDNTHLAAAVEMKEMEERNGTKLFQEVELSWYQGVRFGSVAITPITEVDRSNGKSGMWRIYEQYPPGKLNRIIKDDENFYTPQADTDFIASTDPMEYKTKESVKKDPSDAAMTIMNFPDATRDTLMGRTASNVLVAEYLGRRDDPDDYLEDLILTVWHWGCYVLAEANKQWVVTAMVKAELQNFLLVRMTDGSIQPYAAGIESYPITTTEAVIENLCRLGNSYLRWPRHGEIDYALLIKSVRLLKNLMRFNPNKTKDFDDVMSFLLCLMAKDAFNVFRQKLMERQKKDSHIAAAAMAILDYV